jgi:phosphohistidine phosphatase
MDLYVVRHAIAENRDAERWPDDSKRPLTDKGRERFARVATVLGAMIGSVDAVLSSRFDRAWETAELLSKHAGWPKPERCEALELAPSAEVYDALSAYRGDSSVAVVGHEPCLSELISSMLTGDEEGMAIEMKKGAAVLLRFDDGAQAGGATLQWVLTPKMARAL